ncbi:hypothetical protein AG0111_0g2030 [Alternaria gaisen]|uniref:Uncharacterized protein n=1 Tax=Alternaria gaisen TaxID=167740 RepID=A0ACB6G3N6_9PLEO|nr:hypothetical protein AG0111_0g2030 [Alternaria gaisen]
MPEDTTASRDKNTLLLVRLGGPRYIRTYSTTANFPMLASKYCSAMSPGCIGPATICSPDHLARVR